MKRTMSRILVIGLMTVSVFAATAAALSLADSPAHPLVEHFLQAFNSGDSEKLREFIQTGVAPEALAQRPADVRLNSMLSLHQNLGGLKVEQVTAITDSTVALVARGNNGIYFELVFLHDASEPPKMRSLSLMSIDEPLDPNLPPLNETQLLNAVDSLLKAKAAVQEFSGVVLIARNFEPLYLQAFGLASIEHQVPDRPDTKFNLGAINKSFTSLAIEMLAAQGKLSLDDTIGAYLPDYPNAEARAKVTIRHLVEMSGGIGDFFGAAFDDTPKNRLRHNRDFIRLFAEEELHFEPGTSREYSNGGFILLGAIIERASGQDYYEFVKTNIFEPAGMENSAWYDADMPVRDLAEGYTTEGSLDGSLRKNIYTRPARGSAAGGGYSTATDLLKYAQALASGKFGPPRNDLGVAGGAPGINAVLDSGLEGGYTVIVLANYDPPAAEEVARIIRSLVRRVR